jgi:hypothetical protein
MHLLDLIETQQVSNRLPLIAVGLAAVPYANTPIVLSLHWHGFIEHTLAPIPEAKPVRYDSVPSSVLQVNQRWDQIEELDNAALEVAWELGAWDLSRTEARPFARAGGEMQESLECMTVFGQPVAAVDGQSAVVAEVPDAPTLVEAAARAGYIHWLFRPVHGGIWEDVTEDDTLEPGGYRNLPCPVLGKPVENPRHLRAPRKTVYQFGRSLRLHS